MICVCSLFDKKYSEIGLMASSNHQRYCLANGYDYHLSTEKIDASRPTSWSKLLLAHRLLAIYEYVLWIDADAVFASSNRKIENFISDSPITVSSDINGIICSCILFSSDPEISGLINKIYHQINFINHGWWEQAAIQNLMQIDTEFSNHITVLGNDTMNGAPFSKTSLIWHIGGGCEHPSSKIATMKEMSHASTV